MEQVFNPYLPLNEHVPDGEPHVFGDRVYIYGSHDIAGGTAYCQDHYVTWSAPVTDLRDWRYEGVIYRRNQDPSNADDSMQLWAPDVTQGPDGRYYIYYCFNFYDEIGVAVSDSPAGPFEFLGHVKYPESMGGAVLREFMPFDPAVLTDDDGRVYLYYGFCPAFGKNMDTSFITDEFIASIPEEHRAGLLKMKNIVWGENSMVVELEPDMVTMKYTPKVLIPGGKHEAGTGFDGHGFFEASSIRKVGQKYYFVYSSHLSAELCYAVSDKPDEGFTYGGVLVHNGDLGLKGRTKPVFTTGNNHGGMVQVGDDWYIFYHRQTNGTEYSRQGCAEKIFIKEDGSIDQVEITSCGLNGGPLAGKGSYPAAICCHMTSPTTQLFMDYNAPEVKTQTRITESQNVCYITSIADQTIVGYKYFDFDGSVSNLLLEIRGDFAGCVTVTNALDGQVIGKADITPAGAAWKNICIPVETGCGKSALYLNFAGQGEMDLKTIAFL